MFQAVHLEKANHLKEAASRHWAILSLQKCTENGYGVLPCQHAFVGELAALRGEVDEQAMKGL